MSNVMVEALKAGQELLFDQFYIKPKGLIPEYELYHNGSFWTYCLNGYFDIKQEWEIADTTLSCYWEGKIEFMITNPFEIYLYGNL